MSTHLQRAVFAISVALLAACAEPEQENGVAVEPEAADRSGGMQGMEGMQGMQGGMMGRMTAHMQMMQGMGADSMEAMIPMHRQMVANMVSQMNREMQQMNMDTDAAWDATVDSLRQDLIRMPGMTAEDLHAFMPEHHARVMRLMDMHRSMMGSM